MLYRDVENASLCSASAANDFTSLKMESTDANQWTTSATTHKFHGVCFSCLILSKKHCVFVVYNKCKKFNQHVCSKRDRKTQSLGRESDASAIQLRQLADADSVTVLFLEIVLLIKMFLKQQQHDNIT